MPGILAKTNPIYLDECSHRARRLHEVVVMQGILAKTNPIYLDECSQRARRRREVVVMQSIWRKRTQFISTNVHTRAQAISTRLSSCRVFWRETNPILSLTNVHSGLRRLRRGRPEGILAEETNPIYLDECSQTTLLAGLHEGVVVQGMAKSEPNLSRRMFTADPPPRRGRPEGILVKTNPIYLDECSHRARRLHEGVVVQGIWRKRTQFISTNVHTRTLWLHEGVVMQGILAVVNEPNLSRRMFTPRTPAQKDRLGNACLPRRTLRILLPDARGERRGAFSWGFGGARLGRNHEAHRNWLRLGPFHP